ncbi:hypothetical protein HYFRA_00002158 [Hymenoscyphus fraxineus]|uniref:Uncharacterized protein n=1 Tax=Hymenoscyphus fraxineus TaxID=746836 RepID=A0A9N9KK01_9HELO|nr:hypothetical protein HYFRA_00002158 [Hymenoscyphus fraxineus]
MADVDPTASDWFLEGQLATVRTSSRLVKMCPRRDKNDVFAGFWYYLNFYRGSIISGKSWPREYHHYGVPRESSTNGYARAGRAIGFTLKEEKQKRVVVAGGKVAQGVKADP